MRTKVEKKDPIDLLPKVGAEKSTRRLLRGYQLEVFWYCFRHLKTSCGSCMYMRLKVTYLGLKLTYMGLELT